MIRNNIHILREGKYFEREVYEKFMKRKLLLEGKYLSWKGNSYEKESIIRRKVSWKRKFYYKESITRRKVLREGKYSEKESIIRRTVWWEEKYCEKESIYDKESVMKKKLI